MNKSLANIKIDNPEVSILIVTYNSGEYIERCIKSSYSSINTSFEIIIIDNNSSDNTLDKLNKLPYKTNLKASLENLGFGKAMNQAAAQATGTYLFILNPDTEIIKGNFKQMINFLKNNPDVGIVAPRLIDKNGHTQSSIGNLPTLARAIQEYIFRQRNKFETFAPATEDPIKVECAYGAAWLIKKDLFLEMGGFDNKYFMYFEDLDFCRRLFRKNLKIYYFPNFVIKHEVGASSKTNPKTLQYSKESTVMYYGLFRTNLLYFIRRLGHLIDKLVVKND